MRRSTTERTPRVELLPVAARRISLRSVIAGLADHLFRLLNALTQKIGCIDCPACAARTKVLTGVEEGVQGVHKIPDIFASHPRFLADFKD